MSRLRPLFWIGKHLRGELPLSWSFWLGGLLQAVIVKAIAYAVYLVMDLPAVTIDEPYLTITYSALVFGLTLPVFFLWVVGTLRSAWRTGAATRGWLWPSVAITTVIVLVAFTVRTAYVETVPPIMDAYQFAAGDPEWGKAQISLVNDGNELAVRGAITELLAAEFRNDLDAHRGVKRVSLDSTGGRLAPAEEMRRQIQSHHLDTIVSRDCESACTVIFLGGRRRLITPNAKLGFHAFTLEGKVTSAFYGPVIDEGVKVGVSREFLLTVYATDLENVWYPSAKQLKASGFATDIVPVAN